MFGILASLFSNAFSFFSVLELRTLKPDTRADFGVFAVTVDPWSIVKPDYNQSYLPYGESCVVCLFLLV
jgi:hypothetical protein